MCLLENIFGQQLSMCLLDSMCYNYVQMRLLTRIYGITLDWTGLCLVPLVLSDQLINDVTIEHHHRPLLSL